MSSPHKNNTPSALNEYEVLPNGCEAHWEVVERILFIYAKLNPGIAYVQGMNEIVGPLYYTFATDPNSEWKGRQALSCRRSHSWVPKEREGAGLTDRLHGAQKPNLLSYIYAHVRAGLAGLDLRPFPALPS